MKKQEIIMGMPVIIEIVGRVDEKIFQDAFDYLRYIDEKFSPFKQNSEVTKINNKQSLAGLAGKRLKMSKDMKLILNLAEGTKKETDGYFDIYRNGYMNPSGIVKGWAIYRSSQILKNLGYKNFFIDVGGDIQTCGLNDQGEKWRVGIRNPFKLDEHVKILHLSDEGVATSGTYERGNHIYNPKGEMDSIVSLTVVGPNVYEADRFATPAFAMGSEGIRFIEKQKGLEGYMIDCNGIATMTSGFEQYV